jgi:photoactive yellow protein
MNETLSGVTKRVQVSSVAAQPDGLLSEVIEHLPLGMIVLDRHARVALYNRAEERLAGRQRARVLGRDFFREVAPCLAVERLAGFFHDRIGQSPIDVRFDFSFPLPFVETPREVALRLFSIESGGEPFGCIVLEDVSLQRSIERMKDTLTALVLHDVKNPLAAAMLSLGVLESDGAKTREAARAQALREGKEALERARRMLHDVLDITRLESSAMPLTRAHVDLREVAKEVARANQSLGAARACETILEIPEQPIACEVDVEVIRRALDNLLDNAYRHSRPGQRVWIRVASSASAAEVEVADEGSGVPPAIRDHIFDKFVRADARNTSGSNQGLGLTLVKLAAAAHGGDVSVDCPGTGGTVFRLRLPFSVSPPSG